MAICALPPNPDVAGLQLYSYCSTGVVRLSTLVCCTRGKCSMSLCSLAISCTFHCVDITAGMSRPRSELSVTYCSCSNATTTVPYEGSGDILFVVSYYVVNCKLLEGLICCKPMLINLDQARKTVLTNATLAKAAKQ